jgi:hypothetical protein
MISAPTPHYENIDGNGKATFSSFRYLFLRHLFVTDKSANGIKIFSNNFINKQFFGVFMKVES